MIDDESTGPTGPTGPTESSGASGPIPFLFPMVPVELVPTPPITIEELMDSYDAKVAQEELDKTTLYNMLNESSDSLRTVLLQWASHRFPDAYIIKRITLNIPSVCSDGVSRTVSEYFMYCFGTDMVTLLEKFKEKVQGIDFGYSFENNTLRIHVTKI
jgi:hypothetical protein